MEWLKRMNDALSYIEDNLDGEISVERASQLACCSQYHFQRMFSYIIGVSLAEYLRRRRLTLAGFDLQVGHKVLDVALRYGYDSPTAFNRAFRALHGIAPSEAQKPNAPLKAFPPISFQITIKGVVGMDYRIMEKEGFRVVGIRIEIGDDVHANAEKIMPFWVEAGADGRLEKIINLINGEPAGLLGMGCGDENSDNGWYYICAATDKPTPDGMFEVNIPKHTWAIFAGEGKPDTIADLITRIYTEWQPTSGYEWADTLDLEVYLSDNPTNMKYEVWMPIKKK